MRLGRLGIAVLLALGAPVPASAGSIIDELRLGLFEHNLEPGGREDGIDLNGEILLAPLDLLLDPRPHFGTTVSLTGETSQLYAGFTWQVPLGETFFIEASFGGAIHDGPLDQPGVASYGCTWNFRETASLGWRMTGRLSLLATIEHMSNADLCDRNRGLTNGGLRLGYALD